VGGIAGSAPFAYIAGSSDVFINIYGLTETQYGWLFAFLAVAMIGSTQMNHLLLVKYSSQKIIRVALSYQMLVGLVMIGGVWFDVFNVWALVGSMFIFLTGHGLSVPNAAALSLAPFDQNAGSASAMMGFMRMALGGIVSALVSFFHDGTAIPMVVLMAASILGGGLVLLIYHNKIKFHLPRSKKKQTCVAH
jgi:DHA1 family bicyclomycin/chloramphenicol resistance-like MFS transporter